MKYDVYSDTLIARVKDEIGLLAIQQFKSGKESCLMYQDAEGNWDYKNRLELPDFHEWHLGRMSAKWDTVYEGYRKQGMDNQWSVCSLSHCEFTFSHEPTYPDVEAAHIIAEELQFVVEESICEHCGQPHHWSDGEAPFWQRFKAATGTYWLCPECYVEVDDYHQREHQREACRQDAKNKQYRNKAESL